MVKLKQTDGQEQSNNSSPQFQQEGYNALRRISELIRKGLRLFEAVVRGKPLPEEDLEDRVDDAPPTTRGTSDSIVAETEVEPPVKDEPSSEGASDNKEVKELESKSKSSKKSSKKKEEGITSDASSTGTKQETPSPSGSLTARMARLKAQKEAQRQEDEKKEQGQEKEQEVKVSKPKSKNSTKKKAPSSKAKAEKEKEEEGSSNSSSPVVDTSVDEVKELEVTGTPVGQDGNSDKVAVSEKKPRHRVSPSKAGKRPKDRKVTTLAEEEANDFVPPVSLTNSTSSSYGTLVGNSVEVEGGSSSSTKNTTGTLVGNTENLTYGDTSEGTLEEYISSTLVKKEKEEEQGTAELPDYVMGSTVTEENASPVIFDSPLNSSDKGLEVYEEKVLRERAKQYYQAVVDAFSMTSYKRFLQGHDVKDTDLYFFFTPSDYSSVVSVFVHGVARPVAKINLQAKGGGVYSPQVKDIVPEYYVKTDVYANKPLSILKGGAILDSARGIADYLKATKDYKVYNVRVEYNPNSEAVVVVVQTSKGKFIL